jgi:hypothetical protein
MINGGEEEEAVCSTRSLYNDEERQTEGKGDRVGRGKMLSILIGDK